MLRNYQMEISNLYLKILEYMSSSCDAFTPYLLDSNLIWSPSLHGPDRLHLYDDYGMFNETLTYKGVLSRKLRSFFECVDLFGIVHVDYYKQFALKVGSYKCYYKEDYISTARYEALRREAADPHDDLEFESCVSNYLSTYPDYVKKQVAKKYKKFTPNHKIVQPKLFE